VNIHYRSAVACKIDFHEEDTLSEFDFDALWDYENPEVTEQKFQKLLEKSSITIDKHHYCQLMTQIARAQSLQQKFELANRTLDETLQAMGDMMSVTFVRYLLERGRVYNSSGDRIRARSFFLEAWAMGNRLQADFYAIDAAHMMAIVEEPQKQLDWNLLALNRVEETSDERARQWLGALYNNIGWTYHEKGDFQTALEYFQKGVAYRETQNNPRPLFIAKWCVARALRSLNKTEDALAIQRDLLSELRHNGVSSEGFVYEELGECLLNLERSDEAKTYFAAAYEVLSKDSWFASNEAKRLDRLKALAEAPEDGIP
jgi:tetratricopeptide (TPR) repeat protein